MSTAKVVLLNPMLGSLLQATACLGLVYAQLS